VAACFLLCTVQDCWEGLNYLELYVDTIKVYDGKGIDIVENPERQALINNLVQSYINDPYIIGWYGLDEPLSIDNYEPYRVIDEIIRGVQGSQIRLHAALTTGWNGQYGNFTTGTHPLYPAEEFWLRAKPKSIEVNLYNYHYPYKPWWEPPLPVIPNWREENIKYVTDLNLDKINDFDSSFAFSTQSGAYYDINEDCEIYDSSIIPSPSQILYHVNLGLLYGAKQIRCDPFFSYEWLPDCPDVWRTAGLIDKNNDTTANYNFFRFTLIPRLNGWFGKTLKRLNQFKQFPKLDVLVDPENFTPHEFVDFIKATGGPSDTCWVDLGFFKDPQDLSAKYFMTVNRYYSNKHSMQFGLDSLTNFTNWNITSYIDSTNFTVLPTNGKAQFFDDIYPGDAKLYSVIPVVLYGGTLIANDTVQGGIILQNDMIIDNGATLTISGNYYAQGNIIIKNGSIVNGDNGKIIFEDGKKLKIEGTATINGTAQNKLVFEFESPGSGETEYGIVVESGGSLSISYCEVNNAKTGLTAGLNTHYLNVEYVDFNDCINSSINIIGQQSGAQQPGVTPPPQKSRIVT
jgi:hypothetical protein